MSLKVNTHIVDATPEYIEPVTEGNDLKANTVNAVYINYSNPEVHKGPSLEQRTQVLEGFFADEHILLVKIVKSKL